jgi:hypothetical protein
MTRHPTPRAHGPGRPRHRIALLALATAALASGCGPGTGQQDSAAPLATDSTAVTGLPQGATARTDSTPQPVPPPPAQQVSIADSMRVATARQASGPSRGDVLAMLAGVVGLALGLGAVAYVAYAVPLRREVARLRDELYETRSEFAELQENFRRLHATARELGEQILKYAPAFASAHARPVVADLEPGGNGADDQHEPYHRDAV